MCELRKLKNDIRAELLDRRKNLPPENRALWDEKISDILLGSISYRFCDIMLAYSSTKLEVSTDKIIDKALENNKIVACPVSNTADNTIFFSAIETRSELKIGGYNILEPAGENLNRLDFSDSGASRKPLAICLVPCLAYDPYGYRIGYGKGYYDRFLSSFEGTKIGLCYSDFKSDKLPRGKYDMKLDIIITEKGVTVVK
ncbi:MAG: 5-formyltetrahydrofolate cyclo-ligase [Oscillospiraceae bacterium]|nr:5-formyltetrahydrofolate cyclo-ligase [Oscillospiraceae bacterium]